MRKLSMLAALLLAGAAYADDRMGSTAEETKEAGRAAARDTREAGEKAERKMEQMGRDTRDTTAAERERMARAGENERDRMKKDDFEIEGKVSKVSGDKLTLNRDDATTATLHVDSTTKIEVDGNAARLSQLKPGQEVKASFNLKDDKPMAIEIKVDSD